VGDDGPRARGGLDFWLSALESRTRFVMVDEMRYDTLVLRFSIARVIMKVVCGQVVPSFLCNALCYSVGVRPNC